MKATIFAISFLIFASGIFADEFENRQWNGGSAGGSSSAFKRQIRKLEYQLEEEQKIDGQGKENLIWDMLDKTKLGEKLSDIRMFVPLLISESLWRNMKEYELTFQEKMKKTAVKILIVH